MVFDKLNGLTIGVVVFAIVMVVGFLVVAQVETQIISIDSVDVSNTSTFSYGYNGTTAVADAMDDIPGWIPLIIIAFIGAVLLGLVTLFKKRR